MSSFWLCDLCDQPHWLTEEGHFICEGNPFAFERRAMVDRHGRGGKRYDEPEDVCHGFRERGEK